MVLTELGISIEVMAQAEDSSSAMVKFIYNGEPTPISALSATISTQQLAGQVSFSATVSGGDGNYSYAWDFGVDNASSTAAAPSYSYSTAGNYLVTLTITDGQGSVFSNSTTVIVSDLLDAMFVSTVTGLSVSFTNQSSGGVGALSYLWQFGDGVTSTVVSPSHTYTAGSYTATLTVTDSQGQSDIFSQTLAIAAPVSTTQQSSSGSSGGSLGILSIGLLGLLAGYRRQRLS